MTDPDVLETVVENLGDRMREQPDALYWSVSQNDTYASTAITAPVPPAGSWTSRPALRAVRSSLSPTAWPLGSRTKMISTLAYRYSRTAPKGIRPADNVNIMLCDIECNRHRPIETDPTSRAFRTDFEEWGKSPKVS